MNQKGSIIIVDDDYDDLDIFNMALSDLGVENKVLLFQSAIDFLDYIRNASDQVFFILCDVNMPVIDGFQLRHKIYIDPVLEAVSMPFIFCSTTVVNKQVFKTYKYPIQGYFQKPQGFRNIKTMFTRILAYWGSNSALN